MRRLGIVVFSSHSGLGNQSRRLTQMLRPERILLVDNSSFSKNTEQHPDWYEGFNGYVSNGFPTYKVVKAFLNGLSHLYVIENPLNWELIRLAHQNRIRTYIASNFEFCDNLIHPDLPLPDMFLMPSYWKVEEMRERFGADKVRYLPPPVFPEEFKDARERNMNRTSKRRFLHIVGTLAAADRNGTLILLEALKYCKSDFDLVIKTQHVLPDEYTIHDHRLFYKIGSEAEVGDMYKDFDAMIMPRRFGGLCLPMQEALMSGLPVLMPDISPNRELLPQSWLVPAHKAGEIRTRTMIDLYMPTPQDLARLIDKFATMPAHEMEVHKIDAFDIAHRSFAPSSLQEEYEKLW